MIVLAVLAVLATTGPALAHRLDADCFIRPGWKVQVESWFETGDSPKGARVQVFRSDGQLFAEGRLDGQGVFVFSFTEVEPLRVVVSAGAGHRAEVKVSAEALRRTVLCTCAACVSSSPFLTAPLLAPVRTKRESMPSASDDSNEPDPWSHSEALAQHRGAFPPQGALAGVGILLAVAALFSWRNARKGRER
jgi:nickel transport protein